MAQGLHFGTALCIVDYGIVQKNSTRTGLLLSICRVGLQLFSLKFLLFNSKDFYSKLFSRKLLSKKNRFGELENC